VSVQGSTPPADDGVTVAVEAASVGDPAWLGPGARGVRGLAAVGRVTATGAGATHLAGARVVVGAAQACGECDVCRRGGATVCPVGRTFGVDTPGTVAATIEARARWVLPLGGGLDVPGPAAALLGHEAALAYALYARAGVGPRDATVVVGDDAVARLLCEVLAAKSAAAIRVSGEPDIAAVRAEAEERGHAAKPWKIFATDAAAARRALALAGPRVTIAIAAIGTDPVDVGPALAREATVIGVRGAHPDLLPEIAALAVRGELDLAGAAEIVERGELEAALARPRGGRALVVRF
jgi:L-iditol 2-dehydrogenase